MSKLELGVDNEIDGQATRAALKRELQFAGSQASLGGSVLSRTSHITYQHVISSTAMDALKHAEVSLDRLYCWHRGQGKS